MAHVIKVAHLLETIPMAFCRASVLKSELFRPLLHRSWVSLSVLSFRKEALRAGSFYSHLCDELPARPLLADVARLRPDNASFPTRRSRKGQFDVCRFSMVWPHYGRFAFFSLIDSCEVRGKNRLPEFHVVVQT